MPRAATSALNMQPNLDDQQASLDKSDAIHLASRSADSATNRREAADCEVPCAGDDRAGRLQEAVDIAA